jgi:hypothetical protein
MGEVVAAVDFADGGNAFGGALAAEEALADELGGGSWGDADG